MKKLLVRMARQSPALIVAMLALFVALTGTAVATTSALIGSAQIRNNSITGLDVKNRSLRPIDFRGSVRGPRGAVGPAGPKGDPGANGTNGATGPRGPSDAYSAGTSTSGSVTPVSKAVPAGTYFVTAKVVNYNPGAASVNTRCDLTGGNKAAIVFGNVGTEHSQETLTAVTVTTLAAAGDLSWGCTGNTTHGYATIEAVKVETSN